VAKTHIGWLRLVGSVKLQVSFAEYCLFYRALLQNIVSFIGLFCKTDLYCSFLLIITHSIPTISFQWKTLLSIRTLLSIHFFFFGFYEKGIASIAWIAFLDGMQMYWDTHYPECIGTPTTWNVLGYPLSISNKNSPLNTNSTLNTFFFFWILWKRNCIKECIRIPTINFRLKLSSQHKLYSQYISSCISLILFFDSMKME